MQCHWKLVIQSNQNQSQANFDNKTEVVIVALKTKVATLFNLLDITLYNFISF